MPDAERDPSSDFLPRTASGADRYTGVAIQDGRVYGFVMNFDAGTLDEAHAKQLAMQTVPFDARLVFDEPLHEHAKDSDDQCDILQYQSSVLAVALPSDPDGVVLVTLSDETESGFQPYDAGSILKVNVLAGGQLGYQPGEC